SGLPLQTARDRLDGLEIERSRLPVDALAHVIAEPLADHRGDLLVPQDRADFEADRAAGDFGIDFALTERGVERLDGAKIFHWRSFLGREAGMAPAGYEAIMMEEGAT